MKIEWTDAEQHEAYVTRGWWRWRRRALVHLVVEQHPEWPANKREVWRYLISGRDVEPDLDKRLRLEAKREKAQQDWEPVRRRSARRIGT